MQALFLEDGALTYRSNYTQPTPAAGEALIRITLAGICSTDLELVKGYYPFTGVLGHEFVGIVEQCADATWVGARVVGGINISPDCNGSCGLRCPEQCPHRCTLGIVNKDGAFADYITLPTQNLLRVPDQLSDEHAVFTEPLAAAVRIAEQIAVRGQHIAVIGPGRLGMLNAQALRHASAHVTVFGRSAPSLTLANNLNFKTELGINPELHNQFDVVVETTANPAGLAYAVDLIRPNGTIVLKSTYANSADLTPLGSLPTLLARIVVDEITIVGSRCGPYDKALDLLTQQAIAIDPLIEETFALSDGLAAFEVAAQSGKRKILLRP